MDLPPSCAIILRQYKECQEAVAGELGVQLQDSDYVFSSFEGKPLLQNTVTHAWVKLAKRTGFKVRLHDARHTHATILLQKNVHPKVVQERLGNASITTTMDTYSHVLPGMGAMAAKAFDEGLKQVPVS